MLQGAGWYIREDAGLVTDTLPPFRWKSSGCFIPCKATVCWVRSEIHGCVMQEECREPGLEAGSIRNTTRGANAFNQRLSSA